MTDPINPRSRTKASIIIDLMVSPMLRPDIISKYSRQSSKGVYRHLRDLENEDVIREVMKRGERPKLHLNKRDLASTSKAFGYLINASKKMSLSFDKAFVECAISAYGDFPLYRPYLDDTSSDIPHITLGALLKAQRPEIDETVMAKVNCAIEKTRGHMTIEDKLAYITMVDGVTGSKWSPDENTPLSKSMSFLFSRAEQERKSDLFTNPKFIEQIWDNVIMKIIHMATGKRKNFLDDVRDSRELMLMIARVQLYEASSLPLSKIDLSDMIDKELLTPEMNSLLEKTHIKEISQLPEVYRKEAEQEEQGLFMHEIGTSPKKKKFRLFGSSQDF